MARSTQPPVKTKSARPKSGMRRGDHAESAGIASNLEGKAAPEFTLPDQDGKPVSLADLKKRSDIVLYFYPRDMTPGCTNEACGFRDKLDRLRAAGAVVVGVSPDSTESHRKFTEKYGLTFTLLSDRTNEVSKAFGVYKRKSLYGREFMGIERSTFIIGRNGIVRRVFAKVKVNGHADEVLQALKGDLG
jgi:peroxiredoxin Q/BCP